MFRKPIVTALASAAGHLRAGPFEMAWEQALSTVEQEIDQRPTRSQGDLGDVGGRLGELADASPAGAIVEAYGRIEASLRNLVEKHGVDGIEDAWSVHRLADLAYGHNFITAETMQAIEGLSVLRNLAAHGRGGDLSAQRAREFVALADGVVFAINAGLDQPEQ